MRDMEKTDPLPMASLKLKNCNRVKQSKRNKSRLNSHYKSTLSKKNDKTRRKLSKLSEKNGKTLNGDFQNEEAKRRKRKRKQKKSNVEVDEASRLQRRTRYLLIKMKLEQNLIDAYSGEGWKGQSREKIRPETELQRAKMQILKCKLGIREALRQLDLLSSVGSIEDSVISPDGSVYHEYIFCAKCKLQEAFPDNDIILCDGTCNSAFHQKCLDPPLETESIPPGDQGWFCGYCDCKVEILESLNAHLGTNFCMNNSWEDVFEEEAAFPEGGNALNPDNEWPSDDSEDDDYNPERRETSDIDDHGDASEEEGFSSSCSVGSDDSSDAETVQGRRKRRDVDYRKLYDEMFGKDGPPYEEISEEDEEWDPTKRKKREKDSDAASTLLNLHDNKKKYLDFDTAKFSDAQTRKSFFRIPQSAVERLREVFAEDELPSREVKENVSKELGLDPEKVSKWFKNARYVALKTRKAGNEKQVQARPGISGVSECHNVIKEEDELIVLNDIPEEAEDNVVNNFEKPSRKPFSKASKKNFRKETSPKSNFGTKKESPELRNEVVLTKMMKKRSKEESRVNLMGGIGYKEAEIEMERLCKVKSRVEIMKQRLQNKTPSKDDQSVMYIPVAQLREKP